MEPLTWHAMQVTVKGALTRELKPGSSKLAPAITSQSVFSCAK